MVSRRDRFQITAAAAAALSLNPGFRGLSRLVPLLAIAAAAGVSCGGEAPGGTPDARDPPGDAGRAGAEEVVLRLDDGRSVVLRPDTTPGDRFRRYEDHGLIEALGAHLVRVSLYEGRTYMLIHHVTGDTTWIPGEPVVSPEGERFAVASMDLIAYYAPTMLQVYRVAPGGFEKEFEVAPENWGPSGLGWVTGDSLEFDRNVLDEEMEYERERRALVWVEGGWRVGSTPGGDPGRD